MRIISSSDLSSWCCWAAALVALASRLLCHQQGHELRRSFSPPWHPETWKTHKRSVEAAENRTFRWYDMVFLFFNHSPPVLELGISVGQSHEELVLQLQWNFSEDGGRSVIQSCRSAKVEQLIMLPQSCTFLHDISEDVQAESYSTTTVVWCSISYCCHSFFCLNY